ncbi:hypothetical protein N431DRAFT_430615 [Stipitochalara longipes BDJ]|nr:hypothetical protein N431DRAFT_430615 [Stipitochalara longipes BDJ]
MTLYSTGMLTGPRIAPTQLCLEGPVSFADTATESNSSNPLESDISLTVEQPEQETEAAIEVLVAFLDGKELVSKSAPYLYPPIPPNEDNRLGTLRLCHGGHGYYHGILAFEIDRKNENKTIAVFFAASMRDEVLCAWTCRVLLNLNDASSTNLERVSASELAKICSDEQVPSTRPSLFESPIWRRRDQNGKTVVELVEYAQVIIAEVVFNVSTQNGNLLSSLQAAFEKNKKEQT